MNKLILGFIAFTAVACSNCATNPGITKTVETISTDAAVCVLTHLNETPDQIMIDCGLQTIEDVNKIITAHKAAEAKGQ